MNGAKKIERKDEIELSLVSIIVPVYNEDIYIYECVDSLLRQTYDNIEIILVDDGSINNASDICDEYEKIDSRVKVIHKFNEGLSSARISGLNISSGEWVMFMDHDDIVSDTIVERLMVETENIKVNIITSGRIDFDKNTPVFDKKDYLPTLILSGRDACEKIPEDKQKTLITPLWGKLYRASFLKNLDLEKYKDVCPIIFFEDVLVTPILFNEANQIAVVYRAMYGHREIKSSISRSGKLSQFYYDQIESGNILIEYAENNNLEKYYIYILGLYFITILRIYVLVDYDELISENLKKEVKQRITIYYKKYISKFLKFSNFAILKKLAIYLFGLFPEWWKDIVYKLFYKKKKG